MTIGKKHCLKQTTAEPVLRDHIFCQI